MESAQCQVGDTVLFGRGHQGGAGDRRAVVDRHAEMGIGDRVAIRGDLRRKGTGRYTPDQLADGKYVKHCDSDRIWTGIISRLKLGEGRAQVGGMWYPLSALELVYGMDPELLWPDLR